MHGIRPKVGRRGGAEIGWVGRLLEFAEKPSIAKGKKHVAIDITKKVMSIILEPTDLCYPLILVVLLVRLLMFMLGQKKDINDISFLVFFYTLYPILKFFEKLIYLKE